MVLGWRLVDIVDVGGRGDPQTAAKCFATHTLANTHQISTTNMHCTPPFPSPRFQTERTDNRRLGNCAMCGAPHVDRNRRQKLYPCLIPYVTH